MWKILHVSKGHRQCEHVTINRFTPLQETMRVKLQCLMTSRFFSYKDWIGCSDESGFAWWNNQHHLPFRINGSLTIALKHSDIECITLFPRGLLELVERHLIEAQFRDGHVLSKHGLEKAERHLEKWCSSKRKLCGLALRRRRGSASLGSYRFIDARSIAIDIVVPGADIVDYLVAESPRLPYRPRPSLRFAPFGEF